MEGMEGGCAFQEIGSRFLKNTSFTLFRGCVKENKMIHITMVWRCAAMGGGGILGTRVPPMVT
jgi:hypothetical protein